MKFVILAPEAHGHVNPTLPLAAALAARGHEVVYFLPDMFAEVVRANGATLRPTEPIIEFPTDGTFPRIGRMSQLTELDPEQRSAMEAFFGQLQDKMGEALPELRQRVAAVEPDCVIYDAYGFWIVDVALAQTAPKVSLFSTFAVPDGETPLDILSLAGDNVLPTQLFSGMSPPMPFAQITTPFHAEGLNIVPLPRSFQPDPAAFDDRYLFVGPSVRDEGSPGDFPLHRLTGQRVALVSLGTGAVDPSFFRTCFDAFAGSEWLVVAATGRSDPAAIGSVPENVIARPHLPQLAVLERASLFITHGGMNSTMEGLWHGVPLLVVPQHADQPLVAQRVAALSLGRALDAATLTPADVRETAESISRDREFHDNIRRIQEEMRAGGGANRAAAAVEQYAVAGGVLPRLADTLSGPH
jgi:MGT family glycosyltransferase